MAGWLPAVELSSRILLGMAAGIGLALLVGPRSSLLPQTGVLIPAAVHVRVAPEAEARAVAARGVTRALLTDEPPQLDPSGREWREIRWHVTARDVARLSAEGVSTVAGAEHRGWVRSDTVRSYAPSGQALVDATSWVGRVFLRLIQMVVVPLVFFSLTVGVTGLSDPRRLGRLGGLTMLYFMGTTLLATGTGIGLSLLLNPGQFVPVSERAALLATFAGEAGAVASNAGTAPTLLEQLVGIVPANPVAALAAGDMLSVVFGAAVLGVAFAVLRERAAPALELFRSLDSALVLIVRGVMHIAPFGAAALLFEAIGGTGIELLHALGAYMGVVLLGLALHLGLVLTAVLRFGARRSPRAFFAALRPALVLGFSTSSSSATLPVTMESCEKGLGVPASVTSFVLPIGATLNMDGTALYQGVAAVFISQIYGLPLTAAALLTIVLGATLASVGAAGVPGAGMVTLVLVLGAIGVPAEGLALIVGVDRLLDMFRTVVNVAGDATATCLMARLSGPGSGLTT